MSTDLSPREAHEIAKQAFIYGFPMVENYQLMYSQAITGEVGFNRVSSQARLYGPEDTEVVTPNNDTPYSMAWLDLRSGPVTLRTGPIAPEDRYWSFQIIDYFTNNIAYIGTRATGPALTEQAFVFLGPDEPVVSPTPPGTIPCPSHFIFLIGRTQLFDAKDLPNVAEIQQGYVLSAPSTPPTDFIPYDENLKTTLEFFTYLNQCFAFQQPPASDAKLMREFAKINVGPGLNFEAGAFSPPVQAAMTQGIQDAVMEIEGMSRNLGRIVNGWGMQQVDQEYFGTTLEAYAFRAAVAYKGIYANSPIEALYPIANLDGADNQLTGANDTAYTIFFEKLPPAEFFWSLTMYDLKKQLLVANKIDRYSISNLTDDIDWGEGKTLTFYIQYEEPEGKAARNWLPSPNAPFYVVLRMYGPKGEALEGEYGSYEVPPLVRA